MARQFGRLISPRPPCWSSLLSTLYWPPGNRTAKPRTTLKEMPTCSCGICRMEPVSKPSIRRRCRAGVPAGQMTRRLLSGVSTTNCTSSKTMTLELSPINFTCRKYQSLSCLQEHSPARWLSTSLAARERPLSSVCISTLTSAAPPRHSPTRASSNQTELLCCGTKKATAVLVTASTEVDKTGASYYGEQTLHYLAVNGETAAVQLSKNGPIYDVAWSPSSSEFCVVYGFMPAKATVFNHKCDPVFDFGTGPRNAVFYSPQGHILVLAGFGNLQGQMEVWDVKKYKQVCKPQAANSTHFSWSPDGEHVVTATCSPRLRVSNGYKIWHYTGTVLYKQDTPPGAELWEVLWQPFPEGVFPERPVKYQAAPSELGTTETKPAQAYRPPALRNKPVTASSKLHEEEPPQDMRPGATGDKPLSKTALKNQKKREAKKAAKQETKPELPEAQSEPKSESCPASSTQPTSGDPELDKKIKNLKKKLKAIDELKEQQSSGKPMQKNQLDKMEKEAQLLKELEDLELGD
ncbi:eukaryotic translation initiation factor 2A isoform X3 [Hypomesus transpacificus]|uniref:eukaryotic translation initiation factor 2A isoform X3 n=1 Tax=Hypomesus transpacificus TaxID=137520 RepID=UPI001F086FA6|nr:eukaryotic translation initiation factor 2A isoform X3 [Hypomesus transpacificus]